MVDRNSQEELKKDFEAAVLVTEQAWRAICDNQTIGEGEEYYGRHVNGRIMIVANVIFNIIDECHVADLRQVVIEDNDHQTVYTLSNGVYSKYIS